MRDNSRLKMKISDAPASQEIIFLATIADRLGQIVSWATGLELPRSLVEWLINGNTEEEENKPLGFASPKEFMKARYGE